MHAAERFYGAIMKTLDVVKVGSRDDWLGYGERARPDDPDRVYLTIRKGVRPEEAIGRHWCFKAKWRKQVDAFWGAGIAAGGTNDGAPGLRDYHAPTTPRSSGTLTATGSRRFAIIRWFSQPRRFHFRPVRFSEAGSSLAFPCRVRS